MALVGGRDVAVGNSRLLGGQGICLTDEQAAEEEAWQAKGALVISQSSLCGGSGHAQCVHASGAADLNCAGATVVWVAIDNTAAGLAAVADQPRAGAAAAVRATCSRYLCMLVKHR